MSGIRLGDIPDMNEICELGRELLAQSVYRDIKPDEPKFRLLVAGMMGQKTTTVLLVVDDDDKPQGFLLGLVDDLFFSRQRYATDIALFVREGYRDLAPRLIKRFIQWGESKPRVDHVMCGQSSGIGNTERVGRLYGGMGFEMVGGIYYKKVAL